MRILILSINYWPEVTGIGAFTTCRAEHLAASGHEVEVCTTFPYYPEWKVALGYSGKLIASETRRGVRILRSYAYIPSKAASLKRILHEVSFVLSTTLRALFCRRPEVLLVVSPPLGLVLPAILLSRIWRIPYVFDVEDLQPDAAAAHGMLPRPLVKLLYRIENAAYRHATLVTTITAGMKERIAAKGVPRKKIELLEPRMDESLQSIGAEEGAAFREKYGLDGKFLVTYSGNIGIKQRLDVVLDAAALNRSNESILFLIVGGGADCNRIQRRAEAMDLQNVCFLPLLPESEFRGLMAASSLCIVTQQKAASEIAFPSKVVTYLAAGRPIIASVDPASEIAELTIASGAGKVVVAEDGAALSDAILELRNADLEEFSRRARDYASRQWSPERVFGHLERCLTSVGSGASL